MAGYTSLVKQDALNDIYNAIRGEVTKKAGEEIIKDFQDIKKEAVLFLAAMSRNKNKIDKNNILNFLSTEDFKKMNYEKIKKRISNELNNKTYREATLRFQLKLNQFLDRNILLTVVDDDGNIAFFEETKESDYYNRFSKSKGRFAVTSSLKKGDLLLKDENDFSQYIDKVHYNRVRDAYEMSVKRAKETKKNRFIYWTATNNKRVYAYVNNLGVIGEAYVSALFDENEKFNGETDPNDLKSLYYNYIVSVDNRAGVVIGDVANNILDKVQLAVKNQQAHAQSFAPLVEIAEMIIESSSNLSKEDIALWLEQQEAGKNKLFPNSPLIQNLNEEIKQELLKSLPPDIDATVL